MSGHYTDEELALQERLKELIKESRIEDVSFFQAAYYRMYMKEYNCVRDAMEWRVTGAIPEYVKAFIAD